MRWRWEESSPPWTGGSQPGDPFYPGSGEPAAPTAPPEASILQEFERSGLRVVERKFGRGEMIFTPGDPDEQLYFLRSGTVRVYKTYGDYKEATVALLKDGGIFGKLDLTENGSQDDFAEASTETRVASVRKPAVAWLVKRRPDLALSLFSAMSERMKQSDTLIVTLLHREVSSRLAALLSNLDDRFGRQNGRETLIDVRLTHMELANMIASTREAVSKAMTELQREGLIEVRNRQIFSWTNKPSRNALTAALPRPYNTPRLHPTPSPHPTPASRRGHLLSRRTVPASPCAPGRRPTCNGLCRIPRARSSPVVNAKDPGDVGERVGISPIQEVLVFR